MVKRIFASLTILLLIMLIIFSATNAEANSNKLIKDLMEKNSVFKHGEKQKIESLCKNSIDEIINGLDPEKFKEVNKKDIRIDVNNIYKVYLPEDNFIKKFNGNNLGELISDRYLWEVPVLLKGNYVSSFTITKGTNNEWSISLIGNYCPIEGMKKFTDADFIYSNSNKLTDIKDIKIIYIASSFTYMIYIKSGNNEYGIPYTFREDLVGLKNGALYNMKEIIGTIDNKFYLSSQGSNTGYVGFGGINENNSETANHTNYSPLIVVLSLITVAGCSSILFFRKTSRGRMI
jgi:hypothetical protein